MSTPNRDARAVVEAVDRLTTQVKRLADAQSTPVAIIRDGVTTSLDAPTPDFTSPLSAIEVRQPCPHCPPPAMIPRRLFAEHVARQHPDVRTGGPSIPVPLAEAPDGDEGALRTARRDSLLVLLSRVGRMRLPTDEAALLRQHVETELRDADTARAVAAGNKRHVQLLVPELEQAQAALARVRALHGPGDDVAADALGLARECAVCAGQTYPCPTARALDGTDQPTT